MLSPKEQKYHKALYLRAMRYGKTRAGALAWINNNKTGQSRKAIRHQMESDSWILTIDSLVLSLLKELYQKEKNFDRTA